MAWLPPVFTAGWFFISATPMVSRAPVFSSVGGKLLSLLRGLLWLRGSGTWDILNCWDRRDVHLTKRKPAPSQSRLPKQGTHFRVPLLSCAGCPVPDPSTQEAEKGGSLCAWDQPGLQRGSSQTDPVSIRPENKSKLFSQKTER